MPRQASILTREGRNCVLYLHSDMIHLEGGMIKAFDEAHSRFLACLSAAKK